MEIEILSLNLLSPLYFVPDKRLEPFGIQDEAELASGVEKLFCFELNDNQYLNFEPDKDNFLDNTGPSVQTPLELPQGSYLFSQKREILNREEIIAMAIDIQQEGLWQRMKLGKKLYLRYLYEDGKCVTQILREIKNSK